MADERRRAPSIHDVAALAGVSYQTVSRVLNDAPRIRPVTAERVQAAIRELGYRPNRAARALVTRRSRTIGVLLTARALHGPFSSYLAIVDAAAERGYGTTTTPAPAGDAVDPTEAVGLLLNQGVDGIVAIAPQDSARSALSGLGARVPLITLQGGPDEVHDFGFDQREGAVAAVEHLIELGHRRIAHVPGPRGWAEAEERERGYRAATARHGLEALVTRPGDWTAESGHRIGRDLLEADAPTAVFAANDETAAGVMAAARELGLALPDDLSVVGVDDVPLARYLDPPLTTVRQDFAVLGRRALDVLVAEIEGDLEHAVHERLPPRLVVRASSAQVTNRSRHALRGCPRPPGGVYYPS